MRKVDSSSNMIVFSEEDEKYFDSPFIDITQKSIFDDISTNYNNYNNYSNGSNSSGSSNSIISNININKQQQQLQSIINNNNSSPSSSISTPSLLSSSTNISSPPHYHTNTSSSTTEYKKGYWFQDEQNDFNHFDISFVGGNRVFIAGETIEIHLKVKVKRLQYLKATFECVSTSHNPKTKLFNKNNIVSQDFYLYPTISSNINNNNNNNNAHINTTNNTTSSTTNNIPLNKSNSSICKIGLVNSFTNLNYQSCDEITMLEPLPEVPVDKITPPIIFENEQCKHQECGKKHHTFIIKIQIPLHCPTTFHMNKDPKNGVFYRIAISGLGELRNSKFNSDDSLIKGIQTYVPLSIVNPFGSTNNNNNNNKNNNINNISSNNLNTTNNNNNSLINSHSSNNLQSLLSNSGSGYFDESLNSNNNSNNNTNLSLLPTMSSTSLLPTHKLNLSNIIMKSRLLFNQNFIIGSNVSLYFSILNKTNSTIKGLKIQLINKQTSWINSNNGNDHAMTTDNGDGMDSDSNTGGSGITGSNGSNSLKDGGNGGQMKKSPSGLTLSNSHSNLTSLDNGGNGSSIVGVGVGGNGVGVLDNSINIDNGSNIGNNIQCQHYNIISTTKYKSSDFFFHSNQKYQNTIVISIPDNLLPTIILPNISNVYVIKISLRKQLNFSKEIPIFLSSISTW